MCTIFPSLQLTGLKSTGNNLANVVPRVQCISATRKTNHGTLWLGMNFDLLLNFTNSSIVVKKNALICRISDLLVDELLKDVSKELEIDDVIKRMFELEFKEF